MKLVQPKVVTGEKKTNTVDTLKRKDAKTTLKIKFNITILYPRGDP